MINKHHTYSIPNPFNPYDKRGITADELRALRKDVQKFITMLCSTNSRGWANTVTSIPVDGGTTHTVASLIFALIDEVERRQLKVLSSHKPFVRLDWLDE